MKSKCVLHLFRVVAKVERFTKQLVRSQNLFDLVQIRVRATSQDPQDITARMQERFDRGDEAFEVRLVEQRLAVGKA